MKGGGYEAANWKLCDKEFSVHDIRVVVKDGLPSFIQDDLEDNNEDYLSLAHEDWCDLMSNI